MTAYEERDYRDLTNNGDFTSFEVGVFETDLKLYVDRQLEPKLELLRAQVANYVKELRREIKTYIGVNPGFAKTLEPWYDKSVSGPVLQAMITAGQTAGVGPMAAVAGAVSELTGKFLLKHSRSAMVENGGDVFVCVNREIVSAIYAGNSPLSMRLGLVVPSHTTLGVCTSSATVGHSLSFGKADAVCVAATDTALADALATALCNMVQTPDDFAKVIDKAQTHPEVKAVVLIMHDKIALWGGLEIRPLQTYNS